MTAIATSITLRLAEIKEEECREALLKFVDKNCCYGKGAATEMTFEKITASTAFRVGYGLPACPKNNYQTRLCALCMSAWLSACLYFF